jgi:hypothetical protein
MWRIASVPIVFLVSIAVAQVNPSAAEYSWLGIAVVLVILRWVFRGVR